MLMGIDPRIPPKLLYVLAQMGHGDEIVVVDANYPAASSAACCVHKDVIDMPGVDATACVELITSLMPLDGFVDYGALRMQIDNAPDEMGEVHNDVCAVIDRSLPDGGAQGSIERQDFYRRARAAFAVVHTGETRAFGCFILRKGVVF